MKSAYSVARARRLRQRSDPKTAGEHGALRQRSRRSGVKKRGFPKGENSRGKKFSHYTFYFSPAGSVGASASQRCPLDTRALTDINVNQLTHLRMGLTAEALRQPLVVSTFGLPHQEAKRKVISKGKHLEI